MTSGAAAPYLAAKFFVNNFAPTGACNCTVRWHAIYFNSYLQENIWRSYPILYSYSRVFLFECRYGTASCIDQANSINYLQCVQNNCSIVCPWRWGHLTWPTEQAIFQHPVIQVTYLQDQEHGKNSQTRIRKLPTKPKLVSINLNWECTDWSICKHFWFFWKRELFSYVLKW